MFKVCLDPGHNEVGADIGAASAGLLEQVLTLKIAKRVKTGLENQGNFNVIMTREGQTVSGPSTTLTDSLRTRCKIANEANADLFVSIHINAGGGTGSEVLVISKGGKAEHCANIMATLIAEAGDWTNRGVKVQNIQVLRDTTMPAILTENGFIDHAKDQAKLRQDIWLESIADAHVIGICKYFGVKYKETNSVPSTPGLQDKTSIASLPALILYLGEVEERVLPYLQERVKAPALRLDLATPEVVGAAKKIYGIGGDEADYELNDKPIPLHKLYAGDDRLETAASVLLAIEAGDI